MTRESVFKGWKFLKPKSGGANEAGEYGGVYQSADGKTTAMIKQEASSAKNIAEFLGAQIFQALNPEDGAKVSLMVPDDFKKGNDSQIYVKSEFFKNYSSDMYVDMDKHMSNENKPSSLFRKDGGRPLFMGSRNKLFKTLENAFREVKYQNFENIMPASLLIGDFDVHVGNIGVIRDPKKSEVLPKLVRIDFAGSLDKLTNNIHPHSRSKHLPGFGPTNHFREFPSKLRKSPEFAESLIAASKIDLNKTIDKSFEEMAKYYSNEAIAEFAKQSMPNSFNGKKIEEITPEEVKAQFKEVMKKRQESLKEYGLEIKLTNLISKKYTFPYYEVEKEKLKDLMKDYPKYFEEVLNYEEGKKDKKKLKLHNKTSILTKIIEALGIRPNVRKQLIKTIKDLNEKIPTNEDLIDFSNEAKTTKTKATTKVKEKEDLLGLDKKDLKEIKRLKEKVLNLQKINEVKIDEETTRKKSSKNMRSLG